MDQQDIQQKPINRWLRRSYGEEFGSRPVSLIAIEQDVVKQLTEQKDWNQVWNSIQNETADSQFNHLAIENINYTKTIEYSDNKYSISSDDMMHSIAVVLKKRNLLKEEDIKALETKLDSNTNKLTKYLFPNLIKVEVLNNSTKKTQIKVDVPKELYNEYIIKKKTVEGFLII